MAGTNRPFHHIAIIAIILHLVKRYGREFFSWVNKTVKYVFEKIKEINSHRKKKKESAMISSIFCRLNIDAYPRKKILPTRYLQVSILSDNRFL